jgi:two-component system, OmpR family, phosphate regulon response regulator PhoB
MNIPVPTASTLPLALVAEDEPAIATLIRYNLERAGFQVLVAVDGAQALRLAGEYRPDVLLLDWMLPVLSGLEVCRQVRLGSTTRDIPVLMITARGEEDDRVQGLETGADDYLTKPFSPAELLARIKAVLRRTRPGSTTSLDRLAFADVVMDLTTHTVTRSGGEVKLGPTEFRLLRHFLQNPEAVFTREDLLASVWGGNVHVELRTVDVHIRRLRKAMNGESNIDLIRTVRSAGYALTARGETESVLHAREP